MSLKYVSANGTAAWADADNSPAGTAARAPYSTMIANMAAAESVQVSTVDGDFSLGATTTAWSDGGGDDNDPIDLIGVDGSMAEVKPPRLYGGGGLLDMSSSPKFSFTTGFPGIATNLHRLYGINFVTTGNSAYAAYITGNWNIFYRCRFEAQNNGTGNRAAYITGSRCLFIDCDFITAYSGVGGDNDEMVAAFTHYSGFFNCRFIGSGSGASGGHVGVQCTSNRLQVVNCVFANLYQGIQWNVAATGLQYHVCNNTFYNIEQAAFEVNAASSDPTYPHQFNHNAIWNAGRVIDASADTNRTMSMQSNAAGSITSADSGMGDWDERNRISLGSNPFPGAANNDFRPNMIGDGGALLLPNKDHGLIGALAHPQLGARGQYQGLVA